MSFREINMFDVRDVFRRWQAGRSARGIGQQVGMDRKTVGRYLEAAQAAGIGRDTALTDELMAEVTRRVQDRPLLPETRADVATRMRAGHSLVSAELTAQRALVQRELDALTAEGRKLVAAIGEMQGTGGSLVITRLGEIEAEIARQQSKLDDVDRRMHGLAEATEHASTAVGLLESFDDVWNAMVPEERVDVVHLLVNSVRVDPAAGKLELHLHDLADPFPPVSELAQQMEVAS